MPSGKKAVYYICTDETYPGHVCRIVWELLKENESIVPAGISFEGKPVLRLIDESHNEFYFAPTDVPLCLNYPKYLPEMNEKFADFDISGMVTWHEGASAEPHILTVHSLGDVNSGVYGSANPAYMRNLLHAMERNRIRLGLEDYKVVTEATHWSGVGVSGSSPALLLDYPVPMMDIEVGSEEESWSDRTACQALTDSLTQIFVGDDKKVHNLLCVGGVHFDPNFAQAVFTQWDDQAYGITHIIANQWLVAGEYEKEKGVEFASSAIDAIEGGIEAIAFHDKMKGCYKDLVRALGAKYQVPILKHQRLRHPEDIEW